MAGFFGRLFGSKEKPHAATDAKELFHSMITFAAREFGSSAQFMGSYSSNK